MKPTKKRKLEAAGWKVGSARDLLGLSEAEESLVTMKLALARDIKARRQKLKITQTSLAKQIGSSQSRVAKMEVADSSVSMDLLVKSLLSLGASKKEIGRIVASTTP